VLSAAAPPPKAPSRPSRTVLKVIAVVAALFLVGWVAVLLAGQLFRSADHATGSFTGVDRLRVATGFEAVEIIGSGSATGISVERSWSWSMREPRTAMVQTGSTLTVTSVCPFTPGPECRGTIRIVLPAGVAVDVSSGDGDLRLDGLSGPTKLDSGDGAIAADRLRAAGLSATTQDGNVHLIFSEPPGTVEVNSSDGDIHVELPRGADPYRVDATTADGTRTVTVPTDPSATRHISVGTQDGAVQVTTR
jgi:hypothetical protein